MEQYRKKLELMQEIYTDPDYAKIVEKHNMLCKIKKIILKHKLVEATEFGEIDFIKKDIKSPKIKEIFNYLKDDEDLKNVMRKFEVKI